MAETINDPERGIFPGVDGDRSMWATPNGCGCWTCVSEVVKAKPTFREQMSMPFIVCDLCGNKRCPKATDHRNACTNSNEPNQKGSRYGG